MNYKFEAEDERKASVKMNTLVVLCLLFVGVQSGRDDRDGKHCQRRIRYFEKLRDWTLNKCPNAIDCGDPAEIPNTVLSVTSTILNSVASYDCDEGYTFVGASQEIVCQISGTWSQLQGMCVCDSNSDIPVRLVGGSNSMEGEVEIFYNAEWRRVCDDNWGNTNARVVCSQLGLPSSGAQGTRGSSFGEGGIGLDNYWLDQVICNGGELYLGMCPHEQWGEEDCGIRENAGVICMPTSDCDSPAIRLVGGSTEMEGDIEIFYQGEWRRVCDDFWDNEDAQVVCNQLGFASTGAVRTRERQFTGGINSYWLDNVDCVGDEPNIASCKHMPWGANNCFGETNAGVICQAA